MTETDLGRRPTTLRVVVPATSANLGPGFDCLALALDLFNVLDIAVGEGPFQAAVRVCGEGEDSLERDQHNLVVVAMQRYADVAGRSLPALRLVMENRVPLGRGLGSSAAAIAAGLVAAATILDLPADPVQLLPIALSLESHPDNIAAALWGGICLGVLDGTMPIVHHLEVAADLQAVVLIPDRFSSTHESRAALPGTISRADAVFNIGRSALLVSAVAGRRYDLLRVAMQDRLHQPQRGVAFPYLQPAIDAALAAGAHGAALSGAGSSVIALTTEHADRVAAAMAGVAQDYKIPARTVVLHAASRGAHVVATA